MRPLTGGIGIPRWVFILPLPDIPIISDKTGLREWGVLLEKQSAWDEYHRFFSSRELPFGVDVLP